MASRFSVAAAQRFALGLASSAVVLVSLLAPLAPAAHGESQGVPVARPVTSLPSAFVQSVFHIEKSENKNQVHYAVQVDAHCRPLAKQPVYGYWRNLEEGPTAMSSLLAHELAGYGVSDPRSITASGEGGEVRVTLRGFPDRLLTIDTFRNGKACRARALTVIHKQPAMLTSIYVKIGFLFSIDYAIVRGLRVSDGAAVEEKIND